MISGKQNLQTALLVHSDREVVSPTISSVKQLLNEYMSLKDAMRKGWGRKAHWSAGDMIIS